MVTVSQNAVALRALTTVANVVCLGRAGVFAQSHPNGKEPQRFTHEPVDSLAAEFDAFADLVEGRAVYPISGEEMIATIAAFEAVVASVQSDSAFAV
jgi:predicted dehydrogenase